MWIPATPAAGHLADGARDAERPAEAGVGVDEQRRIRRPRDPPGVFQHVVERRDAQVRQREARVGDARPGEVDRAEPRLLGESRAVRVDRPDDLQRPLGIDGVAKPPARRGVGHCLMIRHEDRR